MVRSLLPFPFMSIRAMVMANIHDTGPTSLACAAKLSGYVATLCVAGVAPYDAEGLDWMSGQGEDSKSQCGQWYCMGPC